MSKTLIVYYSRDGNTKKVAEKLAEQMSCDIIQITEAKSRKGILGFLKAGMESFPKDSAADYSPGDKSRRL